MTGSPALRAIDAQRAWLYWRYGPESPSSDDRVLDVEVDVLVALRREVREHDRADADLARDLVDDVRRQRRGCVSAIARAHLVLGDREHLAHQHDVAERASPVFLPPMRTRPYGTCSQRAAHSWPIVREQLEQLAEVQRLAAIDDVERAREVIGVPAVLGGRDVARRVQRRAVARRAAGSASSRRASSTTCAPSLSMTQALGARARVDHARHVGLVRALAADLVVRRCRACS